MEICEGVLGDRRSKEAVKDKLEAQPAGCLFRGSSLLALPGKN